MFIVLYLMCLCCGVQSLRTYSLSLTVEDPSSGDIWFRIQGDSNWTQFFIAKNVFNETRKYQWNQKLTNVGDPVSFLVLSKSKDELILSTVGMDDTEMFLVPNPEIRRVPRCMSICSIYNTCCHIYT